VQPFWRPNEADSEWMAGSCFPEGGATPAQGSGIDVPAFEQRGGAKKPLIFAKIVVY